MSAETVLANRADEGADMENDSRPLLRPSKETVTRMSARFILSEYVEAALEQAEYDKLPDESFAGR